MSVFYSAARSPGLPAEQLAGCLGDAQLGKGGEPGPVQELEMSPLCLELLSEGSSSGGFGRCVLHGSVWELAFSFTVLYYTCCPACFTMKK